MRYRHIVAMLLLASYISPAGTPAASADAVVRELYQQIAARKPLGIPKGRDKAAIWPSLSKGLVHTLEAAQACEDNYFQQHAGENGKPHLDWLESGLFSGANERALPSSAVVERTATEKDGSIRVYVRLTYKESPKTYGRAPDPANTFHWHVAVVVIPEGGKFAVDDVLLFKDDSKKIDSRLTNSFRGCVDSRSVHKQL